MPAEKEPEKSADSKVVVDLAESIAKKITDAIAVQKKLRKLVIIQ